MIKLGLSSVFVISSLIISACNNVPSNVFTLPDSNIEQRKLQSRLFSTINEKSLLMAGVSTLQDMGFNIDESEINVGLITASKKMDATDMKQVVGGIVLAAVLEQNEVIVDTEEKIRVSFITRPSQQRAGNLLTRITFQRIVKASNGQISRMETIRDPELYQDFFFKLSKSVFLEAHNL